MTADIIEFRASTNAPSSCAAPLVPKYRNLRTTEDDPAFALIAKKLETDELHSRAIDAYGAAEERFGIGSAQAHKAAARSEAACDIAHEIDWELANTRPTTLAGVAAVLRFANDIEDVGLEWPDTDTIGAGGWHYRLRKTMAEAIEAIVASQERHS